MKQKIKNITEIKPNDKEYKYFRKLGAGNYIPLHPSSILKLPNSRIEDQIIEGLYYKEKV
jgi:hypothetical protein